MNKPLISVIMSVYNEEQFVEKAIQSILDQTYRNFELIIIDDYSTDHSLEICKRFRDSKVRIYSKTNEPRHLAASRNIAIEMANGEYIINQDADDWSESTRIEKQLLKALENPENRVVGCSIKRVENGIERIAKLPETHEDIIKGFKRLYNRVTIVSGTILAPKKILQEIPYRVRFKYMQDWDHSLRLFESGKIQFYNCQEPLYTYYIRSKGVLFKPEWLDYNIYVRNCQERRKKGLNEFGEIEDFLAYLKKHPFERMKWFGLKKAIALKLRINQKKS